VWAGRHAERATHPHRFLATLGMAGTQIVTAGRVGGRKVTACACSSSAAPTCTATAISTRPSRTSRAASGWERWTSSSPPSSRTCSFGKLAPKWPAVPGQRWHAGERHRETRYGSAVALTRRNPQWHCPVRSIDLLPPSLEATLADFFDCRRAASKEKLSERTSTDVGPVVACATKISGG